MIINDVFNFSRCRFYWWLIFRNCDRFCCISNITYNRMGCFSKTNSNVWILTSFRAWFSLRCLTSSLFYLNHLDFIFFLNLIFSYWPFICWNRVRNWIAQRLCMTWWCFAFHFCFLGRQLKIPWLNGSFTWPNRRQMLCSYLLFKLFFIMNCLLPFLNIWLLTFSYLRWNENSSLYITTRYSSFYVCFCSLSRLSLCCLLSSIHWIFSSLKITRISRELFEHHNFGYIILNFFCFCKIIPRWHCSTYIQCFSWLLFFNCCLRRNRIRITNFCIWSNLLSHLFFYGTINIFHFGTCFHRTLIIISFLRWIIFLSIFYSLFPIIPHCLLNLIIKNCFR